MANKVVLLGFWSSPFCAKVKIALEEKGVEYEEREEDLFGGKSELLLKSNPIYQKVPVLLHEGKAICESTVIVDYINLVWPSPPLLPSCPYQIAQARFWADFIDKKIFDGGCNIWTTPTSKSEELEVAKRDFIDIIKQLEKLGLGDKDFFGGDSFGFVDIVAISQTSWFLAFEKFGDFKVEDHCPKLSAWIKRCLERDSVSKVIPKSELVCEFVAGFRKMQGIE